MRRPLRLLTVLGSGGHTAELAALLSAFDPGLFTDRAYVVAATDVLGAKKAASIEAKFSRAKREPSAGQVWVLPRSREVGQSFFTSIFTTLVACIAAFRIIWKYNPDLVLVNGPGTCVPICFAALLCRLFQPRKGRVVYVESIARVKSLSLSGRILYHSRIADLFFVQWPYLQAQYPRATYAGRLY